MPAIARSRKFKLYLAGFEQDTRLGATSIERLHEAKTKGWLWQFENDSTACHVRQLSLDSSIPANSRQI